MKLRATIINYVLFLGITNICDAQNNLITHEVEYSINFQGIGRLGKLYVTPHGSHYTTFFSDSLTQTIGMSSGIVDTNVVERITYLRNADSIFSEAFIKREEQREKIYIGEKREKISWEFSDSTKIYQELKCKLAIGTFRGRKYYAWYTPTIGPYGLGPWKFHGLPGLVTEIIEENRFISIELKQIKNSTGKLYDIPFDQDLRVISREEYTKYERDRYDNFLKNITVPNNIKVEWSIKVNKLERY